MTALNPADAAILLPYQAPYHVEALLQFLADRAIASIEQVDQAQLRITRSVQGLSAQGQAFEGWLSLQFQPKRSVVALSFSAALRAQPTIIDSLLPMLRRWLDLDANPQAVMDGLGHLALSHPGLRLPGCLDRFELAVRAVLGQQITVAAARTLAQRFVQAFGRPLNEPGPPGLTTPLRLFPRVSDVAALEPGQIAELGIIRRRADCLLSLARRWEQLAYAQQAWQPAQDADAQPEEQAAQLKHALLELQGISGIGPWTAHYMLMRGWSWADAFPPKDVVLLRQLSQGLAAPLSPAAYAQRAEAFRPYRSYAVLHLWRAATLQAKR
ncbi:AlkA N-terminal domain-containing protein [Roseateles sp. PN1]|uniref:AlkA N-terminal domain-containing protein n=1 Tax=Roseateles sp. PN1 TaxID=3137372 RepID=UPI00313A211A